MLLLPVQTQRYITWVIPNIRLGKCVMFHRYRDRHQVSIKVKMF